MPGSDLTAKERAGLLALAAESGEVTNAFLVNQWKVDLRPDNRAKLVRSKLIIVTSKPLRLKLTEEGWNWCAAEMGAGVPGRAGALGGAFYAWLSNLRPLLDRYGIGLAEAFGAAAPVAARRELADASSAKVEDLIRAAYQRLARKPGGLVKLAALRGELVELTRQQVDDALVEMSGAGDVVIEPEANQKMLTQRDRDAAVLIGNQDNHLIAIGT